MPQHRAWGWQRGWEQQGKGTSHRQRCPNSQVSREPICAPARWGSVDLKAVKAKGLLKMRWNAGATGFISMLRARPWGGRNARGREGVGEQRQHRVEQVRRVEGAGQAGWGWDRQDMPKALRLLRVQEPKGNCPRRTIASAQTTHMDMTPPGLSSLRMRARTRNDDGR